MNLEDIDKIVSASLRVECTVHFVLDDGREATVEATNAEDAIALIQIFAPSVEEE